MTGIPAQEHAARRERLVEHCAARGLDGYVLFDEHYVKYFAGFVFLATERPVAFVGNTSGDEAVFVPEFEVDRIRAETSYERVEPYVEYPGLEHPMHVLGRLLASMGIRAAGADNDGYPGILGYSGPPLSEVLARPVEPLAPFAESLLVRKRDAGG